MYELSRGAGAHRISLNETPRRNCSSDFRVYRVAEAALDNGHDNGDEVMIMVMAWDTGN